MVDPALYPFRGHRLELAGGVRLHYLDEGQGEPVVMVHGNPTWSFYFRNLVLGLRDEYHCIVPDHVGCGLSDKPDEGRYDYSLAHRVADLDRLLDHLRVRDNVTLVLHDWGGMIGMAYAARHPGRVRRLVVFNTAAFHLPPAMRLPFALWLGRNTLLGAWLILGLNAFAWSAARVGTKRRPMPKNVRRAYTAPYDSWDHRRAVLKFVQTIPLRPGDAGYEIVTEVEKSLDRYRDVPALVCWGMKDFVFDRHFLAEWERRLPHAEVHRLDDCGHYVLEDAAAEIVPLVRRFLKEHPL